MTVSLMSESVCVPAAVLVAQLPLPLFYPTFTSLCICVDGPLTDRRTCTWASGKPVVCRICCQWPARQRGRDSGSCSCRTATLTIVAMIEPQNCSQLLFFLNRLMAAVTIWRAPGFRSLLGNSRDFGCRDVCSEKYVTTESKRCAQEFIQQKTLVAGHRGR